MNRDGSDPAFLELRTNPALGSIRVLNDLIDVALKSLGEDEACRHDMAMGVAELVANVCQHEYSGTPPEGAEVVVRLEVRSDELLLTVASQGPPFDLHAHLDAVAGHDPLDELDGCGLGLPLMVGLFDAVDHTYEEQLNRITLRKKRPA